MVKYVDGCTDFMNSIDEVLGSAEDLIIDNPQLWKCMAEFIYPLVKGGVMSMVQLRNLCSAEEQFNLLNRELLTISTSNDVVSNGKNYESSD